MPDRDTIFRTLDTLRSDVDRAAFQDSRAVRRRGDRRTRRQAVAGSLAAVALVAGGLSLYGGIGGGSNTTRLPAGSSSPSQPPNESPSAFAISADPFLQPADIGNVGSYAQLTRRPSTADDVARLQCLATTGDWSVWGAQTHRSEFYYGDLDATFVEHVLTYSTQNDADNAIARVTSELDNCMHSAKNPGGVITRGPDSVAGTSGLTFRGSILSATPGSEASYYELGAVATGNVLVVLEWTSMGNPGGDASDTWVWTPERLQTAITRVTS